MIKKMLKNIYFLAFQLISCKSRNTIHPALFRKKKSVKTNQIQVFSGSQPRVLQSSYGHNSNFKSKWCICFQLLRIDSPFQPSDLKPDSQSTPFHLIHFSTRLKLIYAVFYNGSYSLTTYCSFHTFMRKIPQVVPHTRRDIYKPTLPTTNKNLPVLWRSSLSPAGGNVSTRSDILLSRPHLAIDLLQNAFSTIFHIDQKLSQSCSRFSKITFYYFKVIWSKKELASNGEGNVSFRHWFL